jgi:hypothetical protein
VYRVSLRFNCVEGYSFNLGGKVRAECRVQSFKCALSVAIIPKFH